MIRFISPMSLEGRANRGALPFMEAPRPALHPPDVNTGDRQHGDNEAERANEYFVGQTEHARRVSALSQLEIVSPVCSPVGASKLTNAPVSPSNWMPGPIVVGRNGEVAAHLIGVTATSIEQPHRRSDGKATFFRLLGH